MLDFWHEIKTALYPLAQSVPYPKPIITDICHLPSYYDVSGLASASMAAAYAEALLFYEKPVQDFTLSQHLASHWFGFSCVPPEGVAWDLPSLWDAIAGIYKTQDGWIRLHTNVATHRAAALAVLQCAPNKQAVQAEISLWRGTELEEAIVAAGGCAAHMLDPTQWAAHPQGKAIEKDPLIIWDKTGSNYKKSDGQKNIRILDCTRILAGPVCTRFLGGLGMDVLRLDPPDWQEAGIEQEVTRGKRCATLDLKTSTGKEKFLELLSTADVFVHGLRAGGLRAGGLRAGALEALGLGADIRRAHNKDYIDVSLNAYGWGGEWQGRRGFDSLVQMSAGIAAYGMISGKNNEPTPLPVQALDHATGYLMAASILRGLRVRQQTGEILSARVSLARTALLLCKTAKPTFTDPACPDPIATDYEPPINSFGLAMRHLHFPVRDDILNMQAHWHKHPPMGFHSDTPHWD